MLRQMLVERVTDPTDSQTSLGADGAFLSSFKWQCALPVSDTWTEADAYLCGLIDAAEEWVDFITGTTLRPRNYKATVHHVHKSESLSIVSPGFGINGCWYELPIGRFSSIVLPHRPIVANPAISWTDNNGNTGSLVYGTDFTFAGGSSATPTIAFLPLSSTSWPETGEVPFPYVITYATTADVRLPKVHQQAIMQLAAYYFRNPEGMGQAVPQLGIGFDGLLTALQGSFL